MAGLIKQLLTKSNQITKYTVQNCVKSNVPSIVKACSRQYSNAPTPYQVVDEKADKKLDNGLFSSCWFTITYSANFFAEIINNVNEQVKNAQQGRLFAVVHVAGKQFKITEGDVIIIEGYWPPDVGDKLTLDKVILHYPLI